MEASIYKRSIGVNFNAEGLADIVTWAPLAHSVNLSTKQGNILALQKEPGGYWRTVTSELKPGESYGFVIDGRDPLPDPASLLQPDGVHGLSVATQIQNFNWTDNAWQNPNLGDYIIYELHTGAFPPKELLRVLKKSWIT